MRPFPYNGLPARVVFGAGTLAQFPDEVGRLGLARAGSRHTAAGGRGGAGCALLGDASAGRLRRRRDAHAGRGHREALAASPARGRRAGRGGRRLDHRPRQGDRPPHRPAADRRPDDLCRLRDDADPGRDEGRREDHAAQPEDSARNRHLRRRPHAVLPPGLPPTSGINAIAHAVEALYARDAQPDHRLMAAEGDRARSHGPCPRSSTIQATGRRASDALYGAWLCGPASAPSAWPCTTSSATCSAAASTCRMPRPTPSCCRMRSPTTRRRCRRRWRAPAGALGGDAARGALRSRRRRRRRALAEGHRHAEDGIDTRPTRSPTPTGTRARSSATRMRALHRARLGRRDACPDTTSRPCRE